MSFRWCVVAVIVASARLSYADVPVFVEPHVDVGITSMGGGFGGGEVTHATGIHIEEHNGLVSRGIAVGTVLIPILAIVALQPDHHIRVTNVVHNYSCGSFPVWTTGPGHHHTETGADGMPHQADGENVPTYGCQSSVIVETEATELTDEEKKMRRGQEEKFSALESWLMNNTMALDMVYMPPLADVKQSGIRTSLYAIGVPLGNVVLVGLGLEGARIRRQVTDEAMGTTTTVIHRSRAVALRVTVAPARFLVLTGEYFANWLSSDSPTRDTSSVMKATAAVAIPHFERVFAKVSEERTGITSGPWTTNLELGTRF